MQLRSGLIAVVLWIGLSSIALAQGPLQESPGTTRPELPSFEPPEPERGSILPPFPILKEPDTGGVSGGLRVLVNEVRFTGNTALSDVMLQAIAEPYTGRELAWPDLEALRDAGHDVEMVPAFDDMMGHAGAVVVHADGVIEGASDPRSDGGAVGF